MMVLNKDIIQTRFKRSIASYNAGAVVQKNMAKELINMLLQLPGYNFSNVLEIGCGTGLLTHQLLLQLQPLQLTVNDLVPSMKNEIQRTADAMGFENWHFVSGDAERLHFTGTFDLVISSATFQWFQHLERFFATISNAMAQGAIIAFTTFGTQNLKEIRTLHHTGLQYPSTTDLRTWLSNEFEVLHCTESIVPQTFDAPIDVLKHVKQTGVNALGNSIRSRGELAAFESKYRTLYAHTDGSVSLTYHPIIVIAKKK